MIAEYTPLPSVGSPNGKRLLMRKEAMDGLRDLRDQLVAIEKEKDPSFVRWPDLDALLDHIDEHGFPPARRPMRRWELHIRLGADTHDTLLAALDHFAGQLENGQTKAVTGGVCCGGYFELEERAEIDHDKYVADLQAYLGKTKA
jgi:hypothetical protein